MHWFLSYSRREGDRALSALIAALKEKKIEPFPGVRGGGVCCKNQGLAMASWIGVGRTDGMIDTAVLEGVRGCLALWVAARHFANHIGGGGFAHPSFRDTPFRSRNRS